MDNPTEHVSQCTFVNWFERTYPSVFIHAIPNGLYIGFKQRTKAKLEGVRRGPSDLQVPRWNLFIEMKRVKGGSQSKEQKHYASEVIKGGGTYLLCKGHKDAKQQILDFCKISIDADGVLL